MTTAGDNDVQYAIRLARNVFETCREPPSEFSDGAVAANDVVSVLDEFNRFKASQANSVSGTEDFTLSANLAPCLEALQKMQIIRNKYDRRNTMGIFERTKWRSDGDKFAKEVSALHRGISALSETVDMLQRLAARNSQPRSPVQEPPPPAPVTPRKSMPQPSTPTRIPVAVTHVSFHNPPSTPPASQNRPSTSRIPTRTPSQTQTPPQTTTTPRWQLPMCPNGSGCRTALCFQSHQHPAAQACPQAKDCPVQGCTLWHPQSRHCENGPACSIAGCLRAHPWPRMQNPPAAADWNSPSPVTPRASQFDAGQEWFEVGNPAESVSSLASTSNNAPTLATMISELSITQEPESSRNTRCPRKYACPGGYNGECPLYHPPRQPCARGVLCRKGSRCTFDHSHIPRAPEYSELPAQGHKTSR